MVQGVPGQCGGCSWPVLCLTLVFSSVDSSALNGLQRKVKADGFIAGLYSQV